MAGRGAQTFQKKQKEQKRKERQEEKFAKRMDKKRGEGEPSEGDGFDSILGGDHGTNDTDEGRTETSALPSDPR